MTFHIDEKQTAKNTETFLKYKFPSLRKISGVPLNQLTSPQLSPVPPSHSSQNGTEHQLIDWFSDREEMFDYARDVTYCVIRTLASIDSQAERQIIVECYIMQKNVDQIADDLHISTTTLYNRKPEALCSFAYAFDRLKEYYGIDDLAPLIAVKTS